MGRTAIRLVKRANRQLWVKNRKRLGNGAMAYVAQTSAQASNLGRERIVLSAYYYMQHDR